MPHHPISLEKSLRQSRLLNLRFDPLKRYLVSWYGALKSSHSDNWWRRLVVWFRELDRDNVLTTNYKGCDVAFTSLGQLRIGSVWQDGQSREQWKLLKKSFRVKFSDADWKNAASSKSVKLPMPPLINLDAYPLPFGRDDLSQVLRLAHDEGTLLIPCIEFLRCYGRDQEIDMILTRFSWDEVSRRLQLAREVEEKAGYNVISLPVGLGHEEAHLLSHLRYSDFAIHHVKGINSAIDVALVKPESIKHAYPTIGPWFEGDAELEVEGLWTDPGTFLGLRIVGYTAPSTPAIWSVRSEFPAEGDERLLNGRYPVPSVRIVGEEEVTAIGDDLLADRGSEIIRIADPSIKLLGTPAQVITQSRSGKVKRGTLGHLPKKTEVSAPGDSHGKGKCVGQADFNSSVELESKGAVRDVWNGLQHLRAQYPQRVKQLAWYTPTGMVVATPGQDPKLVGLSVPIKATASLKRWLHMNQPEASRPRGVLVAQVTTDEGRGYIFEIERKVKTKDLEQQEAVEETYSGLAVRAPANRDPRDWVPQVLASITHSKGIMGHVIDSLTWLKAQDYRRPARSSRMIAGQSVAENALRKLGFSPMG